MSIRSASSQVTDGLNVDDGDSTTAAAATSRRAIFIAISSFVLTLTACGINFAYGVYQELYESMEEGPFATASSAEIDLIGTLGVSVMSIGAPFASAWAKSYSPAAITMAGGLIFGLANVLASFSQSLWQFVLTQGFLLGCGTSLAYIPAVTVAPTWFGQHRGLAMGFILSGTGVGGTLWAPVLRAMNASIGFRNGLRITGAISFVLIAVAGASLKWHPDVEARNRLELSTRTSSRIFPPLANWRIVKTRKFAAQAMGAAFQSAAYYTPIYFTSTYARTLQISAAQGANLIALSNSTSAIGKISLGHVADHLGRLNMLIACTFMSMAATFALWLPSILLSSSQAASQGLFIAYIILYSVTAGAYISLFPTSLIELFGVQNFSSINGLLYMIRGIGTLAGSPAAGAMIEKARAEVQSKMDFKGSTTLIGSLLAVATLGCVWVRLEALLDSGQRNWKA